MVKLFLDLMIQIQKKKNILYEEAILVDIKTLGLECDEITFASDYFDQIIELAIVLIKKGLAYIDFSESHNSNNEKRILLCR